MTTSQIIINNKTTDINSYKDICNGAVVGESDSQTLTNKTFLDTSTRFANTSDQTRLFAIDVSIISPLTTRTLIVPNQSGTIALLSDIPTANSYAHASFNANATSSSSTLTDVKYIQGTLANTYLQADWTIAANNSFTYGNATTRYFRVSYMLTPKAISTNQVLTFTCWLNPSATSNPTGSEIAGSKTIEVVNNQLNATQSTSGIFFVQVAQNDVLRFYVQNTGSVASDVTIQDASIRIESI